MSTSQGPTYISLFSSAGVGCWGFHMEGFRCVATNELLSRRLDVQRFNRKCKYDSGYLCGDLAQEEVKAALYEQIDLWKRQEGLDRVDVVIATPPCQGMSVANQKKTSSEIVRNSLVVESIKVIKTVRPRFFLFENVPAFMKTVCTDVDGENKSIREAIEHNLGQDYSYTARIINFKHYGASSSRQRTVVIGVSRDWADEVSPFELYPDRTPERTLREVIGGMRPLRTLGEIDPEDIYHAFRPYPAHMRAWISGLKEGESAFDNEDDRKKPHQIIDGVLVVNQRKNGDKYRRQFWDRVGPCIHTRNDQLASQNTIHPRDDRVFSIRELMMMMTVPDSFRWTDRSLTELNALPEKEKQTFLKKEEMKIRQCLGEAVPTAIFQAVARRIAAALEHPPTRTAAIRALAEKEGLSDPDRLDRFIARNPMDLSPATLGKLAELSNTRRTENAAYFTGKSLITEMMKALPDTDRETVRILEPAAGAGNFLPLILKKFEGKRVFLDVMDIDGDSLRLARHILGTPPAGCTLRFIQADFLQYDFKDRYDYVIGNPPFRKLRPSDPLLPVYRKSAVNRETRNLCSFFLDKALTIGNYTALVFPKFLLNTPEFAPSRQYLSKKAVECILDFGERGFPGVLVETLAVFINNQARPGRTRVSSLPRGVHMVQQQKYIFDPGLPYWVIYRDASFDAVCRKLDLDVFQVFRDRQITNGMLSPSGEIRVLKSRNLSDDGTRILDLPGYDAYISRATAQNLAVFSYLDHDNAYLTPNMTYNPRMMKKPKGCLVNGSAAILVPKGDVAPTQAQMAFFSTKEYRAFYQTARNYQTRSLNVDACSVFFYGLLREQENQKSPDE